MATQFASDTISVGREPLPDTATGNNMMISKNISYQLEIWFYKEGQNYEDGVMVNNMFVNSVVYDEDLFNPFYMVMLSYGGKECVDPIEFSGDKSDRVYIYFSKTTQESRKNQGGTNEPLKPYPLIDDEFVVWKIDRGDFGNVHSVDKTNTTTFYLISSTQFKLMTTFPQWTTGFDKTYNVKSGKKTGICIKEILTEKCGMEIDEPIFDEGAATINYTIPLRQSAYNAINHIMSFQMSNEKNDNCVLKYNQNTKKFVLVPLSHLFSWNLMTDEIKSYPTIPVRATISEKSDENPGKSVLLTSPVCTNIKFSAENIPDEMAQTIRVSHHQKGTFVMDFSEMNKDFYESFIRNNYRDSITTSEQSSATLIAPFQRNIATIELSPQYRKLERTASSSQLKNKLNSSASFSFDMPGSGGSVQVGRRFAVRSGHGADTELAKEMLGSYIITHTTHMIAPRSNEYIVNVEGRSVIQSKDNGFGFAIDEEEKLA
jgi:hypothetical protein